MIEVLIIVGAVIAVAYNFTTSNNRALEKKARKENKAQLVNNMLNEYE